MVEFCYLRLYLGTETVSCRLLQRMARMDLDWNFFVKFSCHVCKNHQESRDL